MRLFLLLALFAAPLAACLWDYDTLAQESRGMGDIKAVIVGGFPRNPPPYYEMRLERVTKLLAQDPDDLDAYDAAGVACDRLGRSDEAIAWMEKKQAAMQRMGYDTDKHEQPNHSYRHKANLGTFYAHRWFNNGAKRDAMDDLKRGRELIAEAIKEYPNAHFGREKYQLMVMDWVLKFDEIPRWGKEDPSVDIYRKRAPKLNLLGVLPADAYYQATDTGSLSELGIPDAVKGLVGLITMGTAWESLDVFHALALALALEGRQSFAYFARQRVKELWDAGKRSMIPVDVWRDEKDQQNEILEGGQDYPVVHAAQLRSVVAEYDALRKQADEWQAQRSAFVLAALGKGAHPDTHPEFWSGFEGSPDQMTIAELSLVEALVDDAPAWFWRRGGFELTVLGGLGVFFLVGLVFVRRSRKRRKAEYAKVPYP